MNLPDNENIINIYSKNNKKSIYSLSRIDLFLVVSVLLLIITPVFINFFYGIRNELKQKDLFISPFFEEMFGKELTETLCRDFEGRHPDLRIKTYYDTGEINSEPGQISAADLLFFDENEYSGFFAADSSLQLLAFENPGTGTQQTALPLVSFMDLLFYNIELLDKAGFDRPPKTRDEFLACARAVSDAGGGITGASIALDIEDRQALSRDIFSWIWAAGGDFWPVESAAPVINTRPIIGDITFLGRLYRDELPAPVSFNKTEEQRLKEFAQGRTAMIIASTRAIPFLREEMGDDVFGITTIPVSDLPGKYGVNIFNYYAAVNAACAYPEDALKFLFFLAEQKPRLCAQLKAVPGDVSNLFSGDYMKDDPFYSKARDIFESSAIVHGFSGLAAADEFESAVSEEMRVFFEGGKTAQAAAAAIQKRWDAAYADSE